MHQNSVSQPLGHQVPVEDNFVSYCLGKPQIVHILFQIHTIFFNIMRELPSFGFNGQLKSRNESYYLVKCLDCKVLKIFQVPVRRGQFHQRSMSSFCAGRLTLVKYKPKTQAQKSCARNLRTLKAARRTLVKLTQGLQVPEPGRVPAVEKHCTRIRVGQESIKGKIFSTFYIQ